MLPDSLAGLLVALPRAETREANHGLRCGQPNEFCNLETGKCETCESSYCCVTMDATHLLEAAGAAYDVSDLNNESPRLTGPVVVAKRPCPRNYFCDKGRIDDYANASKADTPVRPAAVTATVRELVCSPHLWGVNVRRPHVAI